MEKTGKAPKKGKSMKASIWTGERKLQRKNEQTKR